MLFYRASNSLQQSRGLQPGVHGSTAGALAIIFDVKQILWKNKNIELTSRLKKQEFSYLYITYHPHIKGSLLHLSILIRQFKYSIRRPIPFWSSFAMVVYKRQYFFLIRFKEHYVSIAQHSRNMNRGYIRSLWEENAGQTQVLQWASFHPCNPIPSASNTYTQPTCSKRPGFT